MYHLGNICIRFIYRLIHGPCLYLHFFSQKILYQFFQALKILPKALPEDIQEVIKRWEEILRAYGQPGANMLAQAKKVVSEQGGLLLQFTDQRQV